MRLTTGLRDLAECVKEALKADPKGVVEVACLDEDEMWRLRSRLNDSEVKRVTFVWMKRGGDSEGKSC